MTVAVRPAAAGLRSESAFYKPILEDGARGLESFDVEDFRPLPGTILVVLPPRIEVTKGGVVLPDIIHEARSFARVAAVPDDQDCPVEIGDWVIFRSEADYPIPLSGREDLALLNYSEGAESDLLGFVRANLTMEGEGVTV